MPKEIGILEKLLRPIWKSTERSARQICCSCAGLINCLFQVQ